MRNGSSRSFANHHETSSLLLRPRGALETRPNNKGRLILMTGLGVLGVIALAISIWQRQAQGPFALLRVGSLKDEYDIHDDDDEGDDEISWNIPLTKCHHKNKKVEHDSQKRHSQLAQEEEEEEEAQAVFTIPTPVKRCETVYKMFQERNNPDANQEDLLEKYRAQTTDENVYFRATAHTFWQDSMVWGQGLKLLVEDSEKRLNNHGVAGAIASASTEAINRKSTWTWVTGDQHLSNFGAWRNRHGDLVFGVNDFDEGAIFDFNIDVLRIAVSICNHAYTQGLSDSQIKKVLNVFSKSYIDTVQSYVGNERANLFELTPKTSYGPLQKFLSSVERSKSTQKQLLKFTTTQTATGQRQFIKGPVNVPHADTSLASVPPEMELAIRAAITVDRYGATMMKLGWAVPQWNDDYFTVLDVAERLGSGIGSFGVPRYYVLLKGSDNLLHYSHNIPLEGGAVILDIKYEPAGAVNFVLKPDELAWYNVLFPNDAARAVEAQRRLTSYSDPFLGWILLPGPAGKPEPFYVRQRSPWKEALNPVKYLTDSIKDWESFVSQIAVSTATSHVRGSVAKAPGDFKNVIAELLGDYSAGKSWRKAVRKLAMAYRNQVILDYQCIRDYVRPTNEIKPLDLPVTMVPSFSPTSDNATMDDDSRLIDVNETIIDNSTLAPIEDPRDNTTVPPVPSPSV